MPTSLLIQLKPPVSKPQVKQSLINPWKQAITSCLMRWHLHEFDATHVVTALHRVAKLGPAASTNTLAPEEVKLRQRLQQMMTGKHGRGALSPRLLVNKLAVVIEEELLAPQKKHQTFYILRIDDEQLAHQCRLAHFLASEQ